MATIEVYGFENAAGEATESFTTQDITEAREYARKYRLKLIAYEYEFADSSLVEDYTEAVAIRYDFEGDDDDN